MSKLNRTAALVAAGALVAGGALAASPAFATEPTITKAVVTANAPLFDDQCGEDEDKLVLPPDTNVVVYRVSLENGATVVTAQLVDPDTTEFAAGSQTRFEYTFTNVPCEPAGPTIIQPTAPTADDAADTVTIPSQEGVFYTIDGTKVPSGTIKVSGNAGTVYVVANAEEGYAFNDKGEISRTYDLVFTVTPDNGGGNPGDGGSTPGDGGNQPSNPGAGNGNTGGNGGNTGTHPGQGGTDNGAKSGQNGSKAPQKFNYGIEAQPAAFAGTSSALALVGAALLFGAGFVITKLRRRAAAGK